MPVTREEAIAELQRRGVETPQTQMANTSAITPEEARTELARRGVIVPEAAAGPTRREQNQQTMAALSRLPTGTPEYGRYKPMEERQVGPYGQAIGESLAGGAVTPLSTATSMARGIGQLATAAPAAAMQAWQELSKRPSPAVLRYIEQKTGKPVSLGKVTPPPPDWLNFVEDVRAGAFGTEPTEMEQWAEAVQQRPIIGQEKAGVSSLPTKAAYGGIDLGTRMLAMQAAGAKIIPGQAAKGAATVAGKIKAIEMNAGRIAAQVFITRPGTVAERIEAASKAFVFASSPSATGFVPTTPGAFLADVSANTVADLVLEGKYDPSDPNTWVRVGANIVTAGGTRPHKAPVSKGAKLATEAVRLAATEVPPEAPRAGAEAKAEVAEPPAREPFPKPTVKPVAPITPDEAAAELSRRGVEVPPGRARKPPAAIQAPEGARVPPPAPEVAVEAPGAAEQAISQAPRAPLPIREPTSIIAPTKARPVTREVPVADLSLSKDVPNFKEYAKSETGVIEPLRGKYERVATAPIVVWERANGNLEVITGRHRLDLARRTGETTIPAQVVREAEGFTKEMAATLDAEANIRDNQGGIKDYANYFRNTDITETEASRRGLLSRDKGRAGFAIGKHAEADLYALFAAPTGKISAPKAAAIARNAPNHPEKQSLGIQYAEKHSAEEVTAYMQALTAQTPRTTQGDIFGFNQGWQREAAKMASAANKLMGGLRQEYNILRAAGKIGKETYQSVLKKYGIAAGDQTAIQKRLSILQDELARWERWHTNARLTALVRRTAGVDEPLFEQPRSAQPRPTTQAAPKRTMLQGRAGERGATQLPPALGKIAQAVRPLGAEEPEISRDPKDAGLMTRFVNSPQFAFEAEKYGAKATKAVADLQLAEFKAIEDTGRDAKKYVEEAFRKVKGKEAAALYDVMEGKSLEEIAKTNPRPEVMAAAKSTREFFDNARDTIVTTLRGELGRMLGNMTKAEIRAFGKDVKFGPKMKKAEMVQAAQKALYPDDWGPENYLPHMFSGGYRVSVKGEFIGRARTEYAAKKLIADAAKSNPGLQVKDYKIEVDTYAPSDVTRLSSKNFFRLLGEFKKALEIPSRDVQDATRGIIGRQAAKKKFWGRTMQRQGYTGYSKDIKEALRTYIYGFHRWQMLNNMTKEVQPAIEELRSTGRPLAADVLQQLYDYTWGKPSKLTLNVDASLRKIPGIREFVAPLWLDRNVSRITRTVAKLHLLTPRFGVLNRLQVYQTLYPIVGEEGIGRAHVLMHTKEGKELLTRHGVRQDIGQYGLSTWKGGWERIREKFTGEARNQQFAFLAVYDKARSAGFSGAKAASYAKLRGQLMTQFTPLRSDTPGLLQHPLGRLIFQYRRFPIKDTELLARFVKERNVSGVARWLGSRVILGGLNYLAAPLAGGAAGFALHGWLKKIREEHGDIAADMIAYGLPGMVGIDMSGSLQSLEMPWGKNIYERLGRIAASPGVGTAYEVARGLLAQRMQPVSDTQKVMTALRKVPALKPLAELWALTSGNYDLRTDTGQLRLKRTIGDVLRSAGSFRTAKESNRQLAIEALAHIVTERDKAINAWTTDGDMAEVSKWNEVWPEFYILPDDLVARKMRRLQDYGKETIERTAAPKRIKEQFLTEE